jgi:hypothetical protein
MQHFHNLVSLRLGQTSGNETIIFVSPKKYPDIGASVNVEKMNFYQMILLPAASEVGFLEDSLGESQKLSVLSSFINSATSLSRT